MLPNPVFGYECKPVGPGSYILSCLVYMEMFSELRMLERIWLMSSELQRSGVHELPTYVLCCYYVWRCFVADAKRDNCSTFLRHVLSWNRSLSTASVVWWSKFLATDPKVPGSIPGSTRFSKMLWTWNGVYSASWVTEMQLERKSSNSGLENRDWRP
jgi:hypothetical protein